MSEAKVEPEKVEAQADAELEASSSGVEEIDLVNHELIDGIENEFISLYSKMSDSISKEHFSEVFDVLKAEGIKLNNEDTVIREFKDALKNELTEDFDRMWNLQDIPENLSILEILKERYKNRTEPNWRPFNKHPLEQLRPIRIKMLKKQFTYFEKQKEFQEKEIASAVEAVEEFREYVRTLNKNREVMMQQITVKVNHDLPVFAEELQKLHSELIELRFAELSTKDDDENVNSDLKKD